MKFDALFFCEVIRDALRREESVCLRVDGASMLPWLKKGQRVRVCPLKGRRLLPGDIVLFQRPSGRPVLHRIVGIDKKSEGVIYRCLGDAEEGGSEQVSEIDILGVVEIGPLQRSLYRWVSPLRRFANRIVMACRHGVP